MWDATFIGKPIMDKDFSLESVEAQQSLLDLCDKLPTLEIVDQKQVSCWTTQFRAYLKKSNLDMPISDSAVFNSKLKAWVTTTPEGQLAKFSNFVGFLDDKLVYMKIKAVSVGKAYDPYDLKNPTFIKWEALIEDYKKNAPESMGSLEQTAGQFWAWMASERAFVTSAF